MGEVRKQEVGEGAARGLWRRVRWRGWGRGKRERGERGKDQLVADMSCLWEKGGERR